ncbi:MAG: carboxylesterase family protein [Pseudomonadota bacterium]
MRQFMIATAMITLAACGGDKEPAPIVAAEVTQKTVAGGDLVGFVAPSGAHVWRGVSFAASTAFENRWRAPRPAPAWEGVRNATTFAPLCPQIANAFTQIEDITYGDLIGSEDCLAADIYAPPDAAGKALPVMVWIHGGSNVSGGSRFYDGANLAANENVIVVSVQYRLGPLGWFAHDALKQGAEVPEDAAANFGTLDLIASLQWVRDNIGAFGGDADNVTIFGESAGGHNVASLLASPLAAGLFHRAIIQSGSFDSTSMSDATGETGDLPNPSREVATRLGVQNFHTATAQQVFDAYTLDGGGFMELPRVIQDGIVLPASPLRDAFASPETFNAVPIMTGTNRDEMKLFYLLDERLTKKILGTFYVARDQDLYDAASDYSGRNWRLRAVDRPAIRMRAGGHEAVYAYRFDWDEGGRFLWTDFSKLLGAAHALEIPFVFNKFALLGDADKVLFKKNTFETRDALSKTMGKYWASFARNGAPARGQKADWPVYGADAAVMIFDTPKDGGVRVERGAESIDKIVGDLEADARIAAAEKCEIAQAIIDWTPEVAGPMSVALPCR